jgi:hypothetical protein
VRRQGDDLKVGGACVTRPRLSARKALTADRLLVARMWHRQSYGGSRRALDNPGHRRLSVRPERVHEILAHQGPFACLLANDAIFGQAGWLPETYGIGQRLMPQMPGPPPPPWAGEQEEADAP